MNVVHPASEGLSHLVEAATALTELVKSPVSVSKSPPAKLAAPAKVIVSDDEATDKKTILKSKKYIFPQRLHQILSDSSLSDVVTWLPHGRSFVIIRPDIFTEKVLPEHLPPQDARGSTKYPSFTRKLNRWGFRQATRGPDTGAFFHPLFRRDKPELCQEMTCQKTRDKKPKSNLPPKKRSVILSDLASSTGDDSTISSNTETESDSPAKADAGASNKSTTALQSAVLPLREEPALKMSESIHLSTKMSDKPLGPISNDTAFVDSIRLQRDNEETLRAAKAMLYEAFVEAMQARR